MPESFKCPSCAAPLEYEGTHAQKCPFCGSSVIVDDDLRNTFNEAPDTGHGSLLDQARKLKHIKQLADSGQKIQAIKEYRELFDCGLADAKNAVEAMEEGRPLVFTDPPAPPALEIDGKQVVKVAKTIGFTFLGTFVGIFVFVILIMVIVIYIVTSTINKTVSSLKLPSGPGLTNSAPAPPQFANEVLRFGGDGIGAGQFKDNRSVAVDPDGNIFSADYSGGRVQEFGPDGKFKSQIQVDQEKPLKDLATDRSGSLYILIGGEILRYEIASGKLLNKIAPPFAFMNNMAIGLDGLIYATTNNKEIVVASTDGKEVKRFKDVLTQANMTRGDLQQIALDGQGNMYVVERYGPYILKLSRDGKFITRFGGQASSSGQSVNGTFKSTPYGMAIDGKGNVYVSTTNDVQVFNSDGNYIDRFKASQAFGIAITDKNEIWIACRPNIVKYALK
jgi:sugar lactone lactonase YvrE